MNNRKSGAHLAKNEPKKRQNSPVSTAREPAGEQAHGNKSRKRSRLSGKQKTLISGGVILGVILILFLGVYLIFRHFYGLLDYQARENQVSISADFDAVDPLETPIAGLENMSPEELQALQESLLQNMQANAEDLHYDGNVYNILLLGNDSRENGVSERTDAMVLVSINKSTNEIIMTSFMRDVYLYISDIGYNRLNAANVFGGSSLTVKTIEQNFGISIDNYAQVDFYAFIDIVDAMGGVDITLSNSEISEMNEKIDEVNWYLYHDTARLNDSKINGGAGTYHLNGAQALAYCRVRYADSDFGRTERQREVLEQLWGKVKTLSITEAYNLLKIILPKVTTDLTEGQCMSLILSVAQFMDYDMGSLQVPSDGTYNDAMINNMSVLSIDIEKNKSLLRQTIYGD